MDRLTERDSIGRARLRSDLKGYLMTQVLERLAAYEEADWIPVSERLPTMDEYRKNDARFIVSDGNRVYQDYFNIYDRCWLKSPNDLVAAWQLLPDK
ncbi:MAG: hypothetical protein ACRC3H_06685 [Lachnospiraceae bacterium]